MYNNNRTTRQRFRSSTDINNYNNFLLELDSKKREEEDKAPKYTLSVNQTNKQSDIVDPNMYVSVDPNKVAFIYEKRKQIQDLLDLKKKEEDKAPKYNLSVNQTNKQLDIVDPNMYVSVDPNKVAFIYGKQLQDCLDFKKKEEDNLKREEKDNLKRKEERDDLKREEEIRKNRRKINIQFEINNIGDLLKMIDQYPDDKDVEYNINMSSLHKIKEPLLELNAMIGLQNLKENIVDQILFYIQNLHLVFDFDENKKSCRNDFMHTVIYGPPGTGKTEVAKIIGSIFANLGILVKGTFKKVTRSDLVAGFLGQTALKTRDVIKECLGGVLFIDEAYSLGSQEKRDTFSKECIDTLCEALSDHKDNLMVIIAGYETDLNECFFKYNQGLNSRFTWRLKIDNYNAADLHNIFIKKINDSGWLIDNTSISVKWFEKNKGLFKFYGRDIETLFAKTKITHSRRVFCLDESVKKRLTMIDIDKGLEIFLKHSSKSEEEIGKKFISSMYS